MRDMRFDMFPKKTMNELGYDTGSNTRYCSPKQRSYMYSLMEKSNITEHELCQDLGFCFNTIKECTIKEAGEAIDYLKEVAYSPW